MSSTKPKKSDQQSNNKDASGWIDVKSNNLSPSAKRKRRRRKNKNNNTSNTNKIKTRATAPKHAAPANASTIYCKWYQEVELNIHTFTSNILYSVQGYYKKNTIHRMERKSHL